MSELNWTIATFNYDTKTLDELKEMRKGFNLASVSHSNQDIAYLVKMIDFLLEKVERLEND